MKNKIVILTKGETMKIKLKKLILMFYVVFAKHLPNNKLSKVIRAGYAKLACQKVGKNVNIMSNASFGRRLKIGDNSGIGRNCEVMGDVSIGNNVMMGPDVVFYTRNHKRDSVEIPMIQQGFDDEKPIVIGDDVWIGRRVIFLPGVHVGNGCIIGAGAVVAKDIPDYAVVVGNPAQVVKYRIDCNQK